MARESRDVARILAPPALLFFSCLGVGWALHRLRPVAASPFDGNSRIHATLALVLASFLIAQWALRQLHAHHTPADPGSPTVALVCTGPFRFTRNPLYVALLLLLGAAAALMNSIWMVALVPVLFGLLHFGVVLPEERYLAGRFGELYVDYRAQVRRWL